MKTPVRARTLTLSALALVTAAIATAACGGKSHHGNGTPTPTPPTPSISGVTPTAARSGAVIVVAGANFGATQGTSAVRFGGVAGAPSQWSDTSISVPVPAASALGAGSQPITVVTAGGTSNAVSFTVQLPPAFYINNQTTPSSVSAYAIDAAGNIGALPGSPYVWGGAPGGFGGDASSLWVNTNTRRVYATSGTAVAAFMIDDSAGKLVAVPGSPFPTNTLTNYGVTTNRAGTLVFVSGYASDAVAVMKVGSNGALTAVPGSPFHTSNGGARDGIALSRNEKFLYSNQEATQGIVRMSLATSGTLMVLGSSMWASTDHNYMLRAHPFVDELYVGGDEANLNSATIDPVLGDLTVGTGWAVPSSRSVTISQDGLRVYVGGFDGSLSGFTVAPANGFLTAMSWSPLALGLSGLNVDLSDDGKFLIAVEQSPVNPIHVFSIGSSGAPTEIGTGRALDAASANPEHVAFGR